jgi:hypothetical protein
MERIYGSKRAVPSWIVNTSSDAETSTFRVEKFLQVCTESKKAAMQRAKSTRVAYDRATNVPKSNSDKPQEMEAGKAAASKKAKSVQMARAESAKNRKARQDTLTQELMAVEKKNKKEAAILRARINKVRDFKDEYASTLEDQNDGFVDPEELSAKTVEFAASLFGSGKPAWEAVQVFAPSPLDFRTKNMERTQGLDLSSPPRYMQGTTSQLGLSPALFNPKKLKFFATTTLKPEMHMKESFTTPAMQLTDQMPNRQDVENGNCFPKFGTPLWHLQRGDPKKSPAKYTFNYEYPRPGWVGSGRTVQAFTEPQLGKR